MREWLNRAVSKTVEVLRPPWVRIPPSPPSFRSTTKFQLLISLSQSASDSGSCSSVLYGQPRRSRESGQLVARSYAKRSSLSGCLNFCAAIGPYWERLLLRKPARFLCENVPTMDGARRGERDCKRIASRLVRAVARPASQPADSDSVRAASGLGHAVLSRRRLTERK